MNLNGFLALAWYDSVLGGGNGDGQIGQPRSDFPVPAVCGSTETTTGSHSQRALPLPALGVEFHLAGLQARKTTDQLGTNSAIAPTWMTPKHSKVGRFAYDVFLVVK